MTSERWHRIDELFGRAAELPPAERAHFLDLECTGDSELRREVESLLTYDGGVDAVSAAVKEEAASIASEQAGPQQQMIGRRLGVYRIESLIGQGGMGAVYLAEREDEFRKKVAIKIVKRGMDTDFILQRFNRERQILASLEHPNIARLYDGGTTPDGLPYFVMEYVDGVPVTQYVRDKHLTTALRLRLFQQVCAGVQHAHRNLVVHRDLKPGNILVTREGAVKLLDFGIAKLLAEDAEQTAVVHTSTSVRLLTPDYSAPEQFRGESVTTATDVYLLGAILYELLTGERAHRFRNRSVSEIERVVCREEPTRPSDVVARSDTVPTHRWWGKARRRIAGDLDKIVLMALRKEAGRRYVTPEQLSEDVDRYLSGRPVIARKDTVAYRVSKFVRRNRMVVAAAAVVAASLITGTAVAIGQARRANERFAETRRMANALLFDVHDKIRDLSGSTEAREWLLKTAIGYLDRLAHQAEGDSELQWELATAYERIGDVQGNPSQRNLGNSAAALANYRKAVALYEQLAAGEPGSTRVLSAFSGSLCKLGEMEEAVTDTQRALLVYRQALDVAERLQAVEPRGAEQYTRRTAAYTRLAHATVATGNLSASVELFREALRISNSWVTTYPSDESQAVMARVQGDLGQVLQEVGDLEGALQAHNAALRVEEAFQRRDPKNRAWQTALTRRKSMIGDLLGSPAAPNLGELAAAKSEYRQAAAILEENLAADSRDAQAKRGLALLYRKMANVEREANPRVAVALYHKALDLSAELLAVSPTNRDFQRAHANSLSGLGEAHRMAGDRSAAAARLKEARARQESLIASDPSRALFRQDLVTTELRHGDLWLDVNDVAAARTDYRQALERSEAMPQADPYTRFLLADCYDRLGRLSVLIATRSKDAEAWKGARVWHEKSAALWRGTSGVSTYARKRLEAAEKAVAACDRALASTK